MGCSYKELPAPAVPQMVVPTVDDVPSSPPAEGASRIVFDVEGERASVYRQTEMAHAAPRITQRSRDRVTAYDRYELLCITPCAADLRRGAHVIRFESLTDTERNSEAVVTAPKDATVVRHALGRTEAVGSGYYASGIAVVGASVFTVFGTFSLVGGLASTDTPPPKEGELSRDEAITAGLVGIGIGVVLAAVGTAGLLLTRPTRQPGSTVQFVKP